MIEPEATVWLEPEEMLWLFVTVNIAVLAVIAIIGVELGLFY